MVPTGGTPHPANAKFLHRFGWGLISVGGVEMAIELIGDLEDDQERTPVSADHLRTKWTAIADRME